MVCYASDSLALASLEILVHCDRDLVPEDLIAIEIRVPKSVSMESIEPRALPRKWRSYPAPRSLQSQGNAWLDGGSACLLRVPSALIPSESNFLINPAHPDCRKLRVVRKTAFHFDDRLKAR